MASSVADLARTAPREQLSTLVQDVRHAWRDPLTFAVTALALAGVAGLACTVPAVRATRIDPVIALRGD